MRKGSDHRVCLLTGGTAGIGRAVLLELAAAGWQVVFTGRNKARGARLARQLSARHPGQAIEFVQADLSSLQSVRELAAVVAANHRRLDVIINNAGARIDSYQESEDGIELTFATNHLGHFLLTSLLLDRVLAAPAGRIVTVSSRRHRFVRQTAPWLESRARYEPWEVYSRAKLANALFAFELARRLEGTGVVSNAVDPGIVASRFARNNGWLPWCRHILSSLRHRQLVSCRHAAATVLHAAIADETAGRNAQYYCECREIPPAPAALDPGLAANLWRKSVELSDLNAGNCPAWPLLKPGAPDPSAAAIPATVPPNQTQEYR